MIVSFDQIHAILPSQASPLNDGRAMGDTDDSTRPTLYDPLWGYFMFGQSVAFESSDESTYDDVATFRITGFFTRDAEVDETSDESAFTALVAKYTALETLFRTAGEALAPDEVAEWSTATDSRCIPLPKPLLTHDGSTIYAYPQSLRIAKTRFPVEIQYEAVLREAKLPAAKLILNGRPIDNATVNISLPQPVMDRQAIVGTSGEVLQLSHYKCMEIGIDGTVPSRAGEIVASALSDLMIDMQEGKLDVTIVNRSLETQTIWEKLDIVSEPVADIDYQNRTVRLSIQARE